MHGMMGEEVGLLDLVLFRLINGQAGYSAWDRLFLFLSAIGWGGAVWVALAAFLLLLGIRMNQPRRRMVAAAMLLALCLSWGLELTLKPIIARPRPPLSIADVRLLGTLPESYSFPSGHALTSFAAAGVLWAAFRRRRPAVARTALVLAALIGLSRIWVGHHYPLDVAAGALTGFAVGWIVWNRMARHVQPSQRDPHAIDNAGNRMLN